MISIRKSHDRGRGKLDWLDSYYTFSFAEYEDPHWMGRSYLRVINEDYIQPNQGFNLHPHRDMEIITYVISGALRHSDSMGNGSIIRRGEIQRMSAGSGVRHSEFNDSETDELHLLQIWVLPEHKGIEPSYEQKPIVQVRNQLILIGSPRAGRDQVKIHQHVDLYVGYFDQGQTVSLSLTNHTIWLQLIKGTLQINTYVLQAGDGIWIQQESLLSIVFEEDAEFLVFKML